MTDIIFHIFVNYALTRNWIVAFSVVIPDLFYLVSIVVTFFKPDHSYPFVDLNGNFFFHFIGVQADKFFGKERHRNNKIWELGEITHSLFVLPPIFAVLGLLDPVFWLISLGVTIHIVLDMLTHKDTAPKFFYPFKKESIPLGFVQWENYPFLTVMGIICFIVILIGE